LYISLRATQPTHPWHGSLVLQVARTVSLVIRISLVAYNHSARAPWGTRGQCQHATNGCPTGRVRGIASRPRLRGTSKCRQWRTTTVTILLKSTSYTSSYPHKANMASDISPIPPAQRQPPTDLKPATPASQPEPTTQTKTHHSTPIVNQVIPLNPPPC
jgi:hypothetical protein